MSDDWRSTWNYRIMRRQYVDTVDGQSVTTEAFEMYECHYRQPSDALPEGWAETPVTVSADDIAGVVWMLSKMTEAASKPTLEYETGKEIAHP